MESCDKSRQMLVDKYDFGTAIYQAMDTVSIYSSDCLGTGIGKEQRP